MFSNYRNAIERSTLCQHADFDAFCHAIEPMNPYVQTYAKGEVIRKSGAAITTVGMVLEGEVMLSRTTHEGDRTMYLMLISGRVFGLMPAIVQQGSLSVDICAKTHCAILFLDSDTLVARYRQPDQLPQWLAWNLTEALSLEGMDMLAALKTVKTRSIREAIASVLVHNEAHPRNPILLHNRDEFADFLCRSRPSISRELSRMKADGLIRLERNRMLPLDLPALERLS